MIHKQSRNLTLEMSLFVVFSLLLTSRTAPLPLPISNGVLKTLSTTTLLTDDLRTLAQPRTEEAQSQQKPFLYAAIKYLLNNY